jgi:hypothetical protein
LFCGSGGCPIGIVTNGCVNTVISP